MAGRRRQGQRRRRADHSARHAARAHHAEVDGQKFDGVDLWLADPHFSIDSSRDDVKRLVDHIAGYGLKVGSFVAPIWGRAGGGSAMGDADDRKRFLAAVRKACAIGQQMRELGIRPSGGVRIDSSTSVEDWDKDPEGNTKRIAETFREAAKIARTTASSSPPKARSAGAACIPGART